MVFSGPGGRSARVVTRPLLSGVPGDKCRVVDGDRGDGDGGEGECGEGEREGEQVKVG